MRINRPALILLAVAGIACLPAALTQQIAPPTNTVTVANQSTTVPTARPATAVPATATIKPASPSPATPSSVTISPTEQTLPAGASTTFFVSALRSPSSSPAHWSVAGLPAGVTSQFIPDANPANSTLVVNTPCVLPRGSYSIDVQATISQTTQTAQAKLNVGDRLSDSRPGSFSGSFTANTIGMRRGGPSTYQSGPFLVLQFCAGAEPRTLNVRVQSATSDAGTPMTAPPRFTLFKSLGFPAPNSIQTVGGGYRANAQEVANNDGWDLKWTIADGIYVLAFQRSPFEDSLPADKRPASVSYSVDIVR